MFVRTPSYSELFRDHLYEIPWRRQLCSELAEAAFVRTRLHSKRFDEHVFLRRLAIQLKTKARFVRTRSYSERFRSRFCRSYASAASYVANWLRQRSRVPARILSASTSTCSCEGSQFDSNQVNICAYPLVL